MKQYHTLLASRLRQDLYHRKCDPESVDAGLLTIIRRWGATVWEFKQFFLKMRWVYFVSSMLLSAGGLYAGKQYLYREGPIYQ